MTGIYLLFVGLIWVALVYWLSKTLTQKLPIATWRIPVALLIFAVLLPLPLIDEIVGARQFEQLCKENSEIQVDKLAAQGQTIYFNPQPHVEIKGTWLKVVSQPHQFIDGRTGKQVVNYNTLLATGGKLIKVLGISEGGMPLTFYGSCAPTENIKNLFKTLNITVTDRPKENSNGN